jgi:hypothetical protein
MAQHGLSGSIRVRRSESFKIGSKVYVPFPKIGEIFNRRGKESIKLFDKDDFIIHPRLGKLYHLPGKIIFIDE